MANWRKHGRQEGVWFVNGDILGLRVMPHYVIGKRGHAFGNLISLQGQHHADCIEHQPTQELMRLGAPLP